MATIPEAEMPAPRLELRWVDIEPKKSDSDYYEWTVECVYSLVIQLDLYDIRRENRDEDGERLPDNTEKAVEIGRTRSTGNAAQRFTGWPHDKVDEPFRDGAHAQWDAKQLGGLPIYAVAAGRAMLVEKRP